MLDLTGVTAGYDGGTVVHGVDLTVATGTVHAVVGHNGAGKTTLVHAVAGLLPCAAGSVRLAGDDLTGRPAHRIARAGIGLVPQGRRVFRRLTVAEHLRLAERRPRHSVPAGAVWTTGRVLDLLPPLAGRLRQRAATLSGGEQQMLALARALLGSPRVLLLDEPTEGLSPALTGLVQRLVTTLAEDDGMTVLLVSPSPGFAASCARTVSVLTSGRVTGRFGGAEVRADPGVLHRALDLAAPGSGTIAGADTCADGGAELVSDPAGRDPRSR